MPTMFIIERPSGLNTVGAPNLSADRVRTVPYPTVFREGPLRPTALVFRDLARTLPRFKCLRFNANFSFKREPYRTNTLTVFRDSKIKNLILMEFIRKARTVPR
jgi:hypothetical protein